MNQIRQCEECGTEFPANAPEGLCPRCLLKQGVAGSVPESLDEKTIVDPKAGSDRLAVASDQLPGSPIANRKLEISNLRVRYFGDYELLEEIARGGMGVVYKARQVSLNRVVAVKMILAGQLASEAEVKRFRTEAEAAANLQHPNIVAIHEIGEHEGQHYFSMDYIAGKNLAELPRERPLTPVRAAEYVQAVAEAIHYAHQHGTFHRDLKPSNVLIDATDRPRITDFGLAKLATSDGGLTQTGAVMGTPNYMPPEQASGRHDEIGPASDVYSLGAILYELLTRQAPFLAETPSATLVKVLEEEPIRPKKLNPHVPADLETICLKCLEKRPERRYPSARVLAEEVGRFLNHEPILARPPGFARKAWSWSLRHPWAITGLASFFSLGLIAFAYGLWQQNRYLVWLQSHPGYVPTPDRLSSGLKQLKILLLLPVLPSIFFLIPLLLPDTIKRRRRRAQPHFHLLLWLWVGCGAASLLAGIYLALKLLEAHVWENYPLRIGQLNLRLWLFCAASAVATGWLHSYSSTTIPHGSFGHLRAWERRFVPVKVASYLYAIVFIVTSLSGVYAIDRTFGDFSSTFLLSWIGIDLVRRAIREHQSSLSIAIDSFGLIPDEVRRIEDMIFAHDKNEAALWYEFYTSAREMTEMRKVNDKSAKASPEATAFIEKLARNLQRKYPEKFQPIPTREEMRKELDDLEKTIAALEANQLDKFSAIKSEEQRQQVLAGSRHVQRLLRARLADKSSEDPNRIG
jgi:serine/threonine protein kinase